MAPPPTLTARSSRLISLALTGRRRIVLVVRQRRRATFSPYTLRLVNNATQALEDPFKVTEVLTGFDPQLAEVEFSFKVECGPNFDCEPAPQSCPPDSPRPASDQLSGERLRHFRSVILDRLHQLLPGWAGATKRISASRWPN